MALQKSRNLLCGIENTCHMFLEHYMIALVELILEPGDRSFVLVAQSFGLILDVAKD